MTEPSPGANPAPPPHMGFVDALRGWAFLAVLLAHATPPALFSSPGLGKICWHGVYGVQLFFVVSAFTLFWSYEHRRARDRRPAAAFFVRRFFRIAPLYYLAAVFYGRQFGSGPRYWAPDGLTPGVLAQFLTFSNGWHPAAFNALVPGGWSVAAEMSFYVLVPVTFRAVKSLRAAVGVFLGTVALAFALQKFGAAARLYPGYAAVTRPGDPMSLLERFSQMWLPHQLPVFAAGLVLYFLYRERDRAARAVGPAVVAFAATLCLAGTEYVAESTQFAIAFALLGWGLAVCPVAALDNRFVRYVGVVSFSAYLTHFQVLDVTDRVMTDWHLKALPHRTQLGLKLAIALPITLAVSTVTYHAVERPGVAAGKWVLRRLGL